MIFFCVLAGVYFSLRKAMTILAAGVVTVLLMAVGICSGMLAAKPDSAAYLLHPVNWLMQVACIVLYSIPLILSMKGFLQKNVDSQEALRGTNLQLETEIAVRQETEIKLRDSEQRYRNMFENAVEGIFQVSEDWRLISANPALARMMGYASPEEMIAVNTDMNPQACTYGGDRIGLVKQLKKQGTVIGHEIRLHRKDQSLAWVSVNCRAVCGQDGNVCYYEGSLEDITKRKKAEQALIESEANHRSVVESSVAGFFTIQNQVFRFVNRRASEISGYAYDEIVHVMKAGDPIHPEDRQRVETHVLQCLAEKEAMVSFDARIVRKNGKVITAGLWSAGPYGTMCRPRFRHLHRHHPGAVPGRRIAAGAEDASGRTACRRDCP